MKLRPFISYILIIFLFLGYTFTHAQKVTGKSDNHAADSARAAQKQYQDSVKAVRDHITDSTRQAQKQAADQAKTIREHAADSMKTAREHNMDSTNAARKHFTDSTKRTRHHFADSLNSIRKYKDSNHYKDSVAKSRQSKLDKVKAQRTQSLDSMKATRKKVTDSTMASRKAVMDKIHAVQKKRSDSLAVIKKYKESRRFRDSVSIVKHDKLDSMKAARQRLSDKLAAMRKKHQDSVNTYRKHVIDSTTSARMKHIDSVKAKQKIRTDSLAKVKADKEKLEKAKQKLRDQKMQFALDLKIKQQRSKWSNQSMLKKKWTTPRKVEQNTFTRYNYYFNANKKMDEALANMQRARKEDYDSVIGLYPFDPNRDSSLLSADMDSIIHKTSVGIQIHDPRTKWGDDLYLLMGEAYYYKGGYNQAAVSFRYIISQDEQRKKDEAKKRAEEGKLARTTPGDKDQPSIVENDKKTMLDFMKHQSVHNDAILWLSRTYTESKQIENAEAILSLLDADPNLPPNMKGKLALEKAFTDLNNDDYKNASKELSVVVKDDNIPNWIRQRAAYLNGQLLQRQGQYATAADNFKMVLDYYPKIDMDFYSRKYMAYNLMLSGGKVEDAMASMKKVLKDAKYLAYYEQVYYVMAQLSLSSKNMPDAIKYLQKSISAQKTTKKQKGSSYAALGSIYYDEGDYIAAKRKYDSAAALYKYNPTDSMMTLAVKRSKALTRVTIAITTINEQDSLLRLAGLSEKEQRAVVRSYVHTLEKLREDSISKAENAGINAVAAQNENAGEDNGASSWYFANPTLMQQGYDNFKHKWGNRPLSDNWRRSASQAFAGNSGSSNTDSNQQAAPVEGLDENGIPTEESLLAAIPSTPFRKTKASEQIQQAYIDLANAYVKDLADYKLASRAIDTLNKKYPDNTHKDEGIYLHYIMALRQEQMEIAKTYSSDLIAKYPDSKFTTLVRPTEDGAGTVSDSGVSVANYYDETYGMLLQHQYTDVQMRVAEARKKYKDPTYKKRFDIMEAIAYAGSGNYDKADTLLTEFIKTNPSDSLKGWADAVIKYIDKNRQPATQAVNTQQLPAKTQLPLPPAGNNVKPSATVEQNNAPAIYTYKPLEEHYFIMSFPGIEARTLGVKAAITDFNTFKYSDQKLTTAMDVQGAKQGTLVVKTFPNAAAARSYMNALKATPQIFREYKSNEYQLLIISANNYQKLLSEHAITDYQAFYNSKYR